MTPNSQPPKSQTDDETFFDECLDALVDGPLSETRQSRLQQLIQTNAELKARFTAQQKLLGLKDSPIPTADVSERVFDDVEADSKGEFFRTRFSRNPQAMRWVLGVAFVSALVLITVVILVVSTWTEFP